MAQSRRSLGAAGLLGVLLSGACIENAPRDDGNVVPPPTTTDPEEDSQTPDPALIPEFVSSPNPTGASYFGPTSSGPGDYVPAADTPDTSRALAEADIVQVSGDRMYALSRY